MLRLAQRSLRISVIAAAQRNEATRQDDTVSAWRINLPGRLLNDAVMPAKNMALSKNNVSWM